MKAEEKYIILAMAEKFVNKHAKGLKGTKKSELEAMLGSFGLNTIKKIDKFRSNRTPQ